MMTKILFFLSFIVLLEQLYYNTASGNILYLSSNMDTIYFQNTDSIRYAKSIEYILNSNELPEKFNNLFQDEDFTSSCVYISPEIISFDQYIFGKEIINYEFFECSEATKEKIVRLIIECRLNVVRINKSLVNHFSGNNIKLIVFFSQIVYNKLIVRIKVYDDFYGKKFNKYYGGPHRNALIFLFYYNENNEIEKVFTKYITD